MDAAARPSHSVSVVVVSQGRPEALGRCLLSLEQQFHPCFEVIVVADAAGCAVASAFNAKILPFAEQNISAARNAGISLAAGGIIAFIDDDSAAEPDWLNALTLPFDDPRVAGSGGFVLGRNGISWQWRGRELDAAGNSHPVATPSTRWSLPEPTPGRAIRVEGTNMAFRAEVLRRHGGFDPAFRFYHDETELCWRLALAGERVALVPAAVVHHGFLPSVRRRDDRVPRDLTDIGRGAALFMIRHAPEQLSAALPQQRAAQRRRLLSHMRAGKCMPGDVGRLLEGFDRGVNEALAEPAAQVLPPLPQPVTATIGFRPFTKAPPPDSLLIAGRKHEAAALIERAKSARNQGNVVSLILFGRSALYHRVRFCDDGIWHQNGGLFGRSERGQKLVQLTPLDARIRTEAARLETIGRFPASSIRH